MHSAIYTGQVQHRRRVPHKHEFNYSLFMLYLDLDEAESLFRRFRFLSFNRKNIASFHESDHYLVDDLNLKASIQSLIKEKTGKSQSGPIRLLTHLRYFGYVMNPVSFYYCWDEHDSRLEFIIAEINNTPWGERHCYVLPATQARDTGSQLDYRFDKDFHVSPFMSMQQQYEWRFSLPDSGLHVAMKSYEDEVHMFDAHLNLYREELNPSSLNKKLLQFPFMTAKVITAIYWQACKLWLKRTPFYPHPDTFIKQGEQR